MCWEKFNQYFEVEGRYVPVEVDYPVMSADRIEEYADENTIGELTKVCMQIVLKLCHNHQTVSGNQRCSHVQGSF